MNRDFFSVLEACKKRKTGALSPVNEKPEQLRNEVFLQHRMASPHSFQRESSVEHQVSNGSYQVTQTTEV
jgi:hypothetical protein